MSNREQELERALADVLRGGPHEANPPEGCLCRWCKARRLLSAPSASAPTPNYEVRICATIGMLAERHSIGAAQDAARWLSTDQPESTPANPLPAPAPQSDAVGPLARAAVGSAFKVMRAAEAEDEAAPQSGSEARGKCCRCGGETKQQHHTGSWAWIQKCIQCGTTQTPEEAGVPEPAPASPPSPAPSAGPAPTGELPESVLEALNAFHSAAVALSPTEAVLRYRLESAIQTWGAEMRAGAIEEAANSLVCKAVELETRAADLRKESRHMLAQAQDEQAETYRSAAARIHSLARGGK